MNIDSSGPFSGTSFKANKPDSKASGAAAGSARSSARTGAAARTAAPAAPASTAPTTATPASSSVHAAAAQLMSTHADFDAVKVAEIRASISEGRYAVNTGRIADGLLASAQELVQNARP